MGSAVSEILKHESRLLAYISRRIRDKSRATDILQEAMVRLIEQTQKQDLANPLAYAFRVVDSVIYADARRAPVDSEQLDFDLQCDLPLADEILEQKQRVQVFQEALARLSPVRRAVFEKRHIDGKSRQVIAEEMNITLEAVKKHLVRAMVELAEALAGAEGAAALDGALSKGRAAQ
jgi:RNA polymerase sigma-70 factor (ECF subfamily)